jgi:GTP pyrophosphokinase
VPGDDIIGYITRGRGVSVHLNDCTNAMALAQDESARIIEVEWDGDHREELYTAGVEVVALDRSRLLRDVANAVGEQGVNITRCETIVGDDRVAKMRFEFEMSSSAQLGSVLNTIKRIDAVYDVHRIVPGHQS